MARRERIVCECGGEITRPIPETCPHCGAVITAIKRSRWPLVLPVLVVGAMFAALAAFVWWMVQA